MREPGQSGPADEAFPAAVALNEVEGREALLGEGLDPRAPIRGKPPLDWLTEMYTRSPRFPRCVAALLDGGARLGDPLLAAVLLDDGSAVREELAPDSGVVDRRVTRVSAFTPLTGATPLHVAAEYGHANAARALLEAGADVDARASVDEHGLGGHTPLFHTVNSSRNHARPVMDLLLEAGARTDVRLAGITWGRGFEWETTLFDVTPISYAQAGLLPQMHRDPVQIRDNVEAMLRAAGRPVPPRVDVPNRYLADEENDGRGSGADPDGAGET